MLTGGWGPAGRTGGRSKRGKDTKKIPIEGAGSSAGSGRQPDRGADGAKVPGKREGVQTCLRGIAGRGPAEYAFLRM